MIVSESLRIGEACDTPREALIKQLKAGNNVYAIDRDRAARDEKLCGWERELCQ